MCGNRDCLEEKNCSNCNHSGLKTLGEGDTNDGGYAFNLEFFCSKRKQFCEEILESMEDCEFYEEMTEEFDERG